MCIILAAVRGVQLQKSGKTHSRGREAPRQHTQMWQINQQSLPCAGACCPFAGFIYVTPSAGRKACRKRQLSGGGRGVLGKLSNFRKCNQPATSSGSHSLCSVPRIPLHSLYNYSYIFRKSIYSWYLWSLDSYVKMGIS